MIKFNVEYYDTAHENLLSKLSCARELDKVIKNGLLVSEQEFLVYSLFREQKRRIGWTTYQELAEKVPARLQMFSDYFNIENGSLQSRFLDANETDKTMTEAVGVGASLSLASKIYGLTEADWERISITSNKDLDFQIASTGHEIVELEAKGAIVADTTRKSQISGRAGDIHKKKEEQRKKHDNKSTLLGVIASIPAKNGGIAVCRVLDPDGDDLGVPPEKYKLLARLMYYYREIRIISRAHFLIALTNRIQAIQDSIEYDIFDNQPLLNIDNEPFDTPPSLRISRSVVEEDVAFGEVIPLGNNNYYYYGFVFDVLEALTKQNFSSILNFRSGVQLPGESNILARIRRSEASDFGIEEQLEENRNYLELRMRGQLSVTASGKVVGRCSLQ